MTGFLSTFSKPFQLAVLLWPFVTVLLTVPAAVYLYHRDNRLRPASVLGAYSFMLYVLGLGCFTLYPWPRDPAAYCATHHLGAQLNPLQFIGDIRADGVTAILQLGMNIVLFVLFEGVVPWCTHGRTIGCLLTRMTVESTQRTLPQRLAFHAARTALLYTLTIGLCTWRSPWSFVLGLATVVWWIVCKQMPYDAIGEKRRTVGNPMAGGQSS